MNSSPGTIVIAVGGNALAPLGEQVTIHDQFHHTRQSLASVIRLAKEGWCIAIVHGNGPQVGNALERNELARDRVEPLPLGVLVAATAGWIGYMIQQSLQNALAEAGSDRDVLTVVTQTLVSEDDPGFKEPTKPIGNAFGREDFVRLQKRGVPIGSDGAGRWRRLAASPEPSDVVEAAAVKQLVLSGKIVIAAGGGGPPVYRDRKGHWEGVDAVVDKDRVAAVLGCRLGAERLLILTDVDGVYEGWGTESQRHLPRLRPTEAEALLSGGALGRGSMRPKVEAAVHFVRHGGGCAIIAHLEKGLEAIQGETGTIIAGED
ncbi:MAG: carbamate kinase [Gemmatimonadales bacterium]